MSQRVKKRFDISVATAGQLISSTFQLDKTVTLLYGLLLTSNRDDMLYYRGSQKITINRDEIFPDKYESKLLMSGINVSPNDRYYLLGEKDPGNGQIKIDYLDSNNVLDFAPYTVSLYLDCEVADAS
ncbi:hypothetical protein SAMN05444410_10194 [Hydrobacter penzbergensis]|jgi:hypothetical protein|uniref:Uncharacterized protein n=1 Tax=Hydrobacter penzbergensis TaxID=1235997 RepID=A0A8X8ICF6_9BACT|nr:hypothetical protein [Hydrobacter penzbergensis]MBN8721129.1 hypothetical protein [Sediminibacterium magnilacihabitans]PQV57252.1 hypothetical protein CLV53_13018 [Sediminibacterium magnilacihabitans]SDW04235.1 hypothetical protein SAMN05444410_10194 [Hydrobacter penzbergensis]